MTNNNDNPKIILFNGPPGSGKDTAAELFPDIVWRGFTSRATVLPIKISSPLKNAVHALYKCYNITEETKDIPNEELLGMTPREAYISLSEDYIKPLHGQDFFGKVAVKVMREKASIWSSPIYFTVSDAGFAEEIEPIIDEFGADNVYLIRLHRFAKDFSNDSRGYLDIPELALNTYDITNDGSIEDLRQSLTAILAAAL